MIIALIAAMGHERVIGVENQLPWEMPADMRWFVRQTKGKPVVMGRKTFESLGGKALPNRHNIVVTRDQNYIASGATVAHSIDEALTAAGEVEEVMVIGGAKLYAEMLPRADRLYLTFIDAEIPQGDAWFPDFDENDWNTVERQDHAADTDNPHHYSFVILERKR